MPIVPSFIQKRGMGYKKIMPVDMALVVCHRSHITLHLEYFSSYQSLLSILVLCPVSPLEGELRIDTCHRPWYWREIYPDYGASR